MEPLGERSDARRLIVWGSAAESAAVERVLAPLGFAIDATAGLEKAAELVVLPASDVAVATRALREIRAAAPVVPILVLLDGPAEQAIDTLREAGASDFAPAEVAPALLRHRAESLCERAAGGDRFPARERRQQDRVTGLATRPMLEEMLRRLGERAGHRRESFAVLFLGIDGLDSLSAERGAHVGEAALRECGRRLVETFTPGEALRGISDAISNSIARFAEDELVVVVPELADENGPARAAGRVLEALSKPIEADGQRVQLSVSIGIAVGPADGREPRALLHRAAAAMHQARHEGGGRYHFHAPVRSRRAGSIVELESRLRRAIECDELELHYQPKAEAGSRRVAGVEALLRWTDPRMGVISPGRFIPVAESSPLVVPLGVWVLRTACRQQVAWREAGIGPPRMAVNVSPRQFIRGDFVDSVVDVLEETGARPEEIELEVTESSFMEREAMAETLRKLREHGVGVAVDDFGTGYSSLQYLRELPIDCLKIDRAFIADCMDDEKARSLTIAIIAMAWSLGLRVVAEGVETEEQWDLLRDHGCDEIQGFFYSRPLAAEACAELLRREGTTG